MRRIIISLAVAVWGIAAGCSDDEVPVAVTKEPPGDTIRVPLDKPTIQTAIDAASPGQVVLVSPGTYTGDGNRDINFGGKAITLKSAGGPAVTIMDCADTGSVVHQGFYFSSRETSQSVVDGFSVVNAYAGNGAGMGFRSSSPTIMNCIFAGNEAYASGGAVHCKSASPLFVSCTFVNNASLAGGAVFCIAGAQPRFERCIISHSRQGGAVYCSYAEAQASFYCCDIYGNVGGDWADRIADQAGQEGNSSVDPMYCNAVEGDYGLQAGSPCLAENSGCGLLTGALGPGCLP